MMITVTMVLRSHAPERQKRQWVAHGSKSPLDRLLRFFESAQKLACTIISVFSWYISVKCQSIGSFACWAQYSGKRMLSFIGTMTAVIAQEMFVLLTPCMRYIYRVMFGSDGCYKNTSSVRRHSNQKTKCPPSGCFPNVKKILDGSLWLNNYDHASGFPSEEQTTLIRQWD